MENIVSDRIKKIQKQVRKEKLNGYVITDYIDINYLTNFHFGKGETMLLVTKTNAFCYARKLYVSEFAKSREKYCEIFESVDFKKDVLSKIAELKIKKVGFDFQKVSYLDGKLFIKNKFKEAPSFVTELRKIKTKECIKRIRHACKIAHETYELVRKKIKTGMTELEVASILENTMRSKGATKVSFESVVAFGAGAAEPHHITGTRKLKNNENILIDFGCIYKDYCSDITRTWWHGKKPSAEFKKVHALVQKSHDECVKKVRIGMTGIEGDKLCRHIIEKAGYGKYFIHPTGHSLGMKIHEGPYISQIEKEKLKENNVFTIEPGIYLPDKFGVRIEDTVVLTKSGAKILTK